MDWGRERAIAAIAGLLLVALLVVGCGGGSGGGSSASQGLGEERELSGVLSENDCHKLAALVTEELERPVEKIEPFLSAPAYACMLNTKEGVVGVQLETAAPVRGGFLSSVAHGQPVSGLGQPAQGKAGAYWSPPLNHLYVYRPDGWFDIYLPVIVPDSQARKEAIQVAQLALEIT